MIEKNYQPADIESRMSAIWEASGAFKAGRPERRDAEPFTIVIPPPNVTGSLHMGHALNNTLQDILCRFERMRGRDVLWQPGTDHAGIATQMVVERQLMERQERGRRDIGRPAFLERVWQWKAESGGVIVNQLKRLGASCDWSRERFTMGERGAPDDQMVRAVMKVFVDLYNKDLIYKDKRLVNWDPKLLTAISDLEVQQIELRGNLWYFRYPLADGVTYRHPIAVDAAGTVTHWESRDYIVVATTRPETMLGDVAVAVHPDDSRYRALVAHNAHVILPLVGRRIPIIADKYSDPGKGSGAVKITPAHDFNDFEVGKRHNLPQISILNAEAVVDLIADTQFISSVTGTVPLGALRRQGVQSRPDWRRPILSSLLSAGFSRLASTIEVLDGKERFAAREIVVVLMDELGLVEKTEPNVYMVPHGDRSGVVVEPFLTDQWYVDAKKLAQPAIAAVRSGTTSFVPKSWDKTYFEWMENIQPWCISRQLWWGHQIPAWYGPSKLEKLGGDGYMLDVSEPHIFVAVSEQEAIAQAEEYYGHSVKIGPRWSDIVDAAILDINLGAIVIARDEDVLDTWFSSALWPFSTLGWPDNNGDLGRYYPSNVLVTGFDIIFFWVARMMMMGIHFMGEPPFSTVYIHRLVRDEKGAKMSKSKGNVIDPLYLIDEFGADALRFALAREAAQGHDIRLSPNLVETNRNFATKFWNACRFAEMNGCSLPPGFDPAAATETLNRWIVHETSRITRETTEAIRACRFNDAANGIYRFVWNVYCDWYLELAKPFLMGHDHRAKVETRTMVAWVRDEILKLLHPFMPFITEELWSVTESNRRSQRRFLGRHRTLDRAWDAAYAQPRLMGLQQDFPSEQSSLLALSEWPTDRGFEDLDAEAEIGWIIDLVTTIRSVRKELNIPPAAKLPLYLTEADPNQVEHLLHLDNTIMRWREVLVRLGRLSSVELIGHLGQMPGQINMVVRGYGVALHVGSAINLPAERVRLANALAQADADIKRVDAKLGNEKFVANAPEDIVEEEKEKREAAVARKAKIVEALERLKNAS
jgi:valyl-tRNA synthetase